jgi:glutamate formiminotransferase / formiminotetrahydrofolate cyclodeaminase
MARQIVECIPNFSEGRDQKIIDALLDSIRSVKGVRVLDHHADSDHNRTVITFLGDPQAVEEAAFQSIKAASHLIDMDQHEGEHPRIGAADVVPFVPIQEMSVQECVQMAERLGERVASDLDIPVYLYEDAARKPERINLEHIRKGQYEGLKDAINTDPERTPDFGPSEMGKAGAVVIGARAPLIAFNVYLNTDDVSIAKNIARTVRFSSGGLRFVKAMGVVVDGLAQVSMNLTNFNKTAIPQVVELIRNEARRYGVQVRHSELVGLIPQKALIDTAVWYLQLDQFESDQILENKLEPSEESADFTFLDALASAEPTPGGGSAAAYTAASAAALVVMVARVSIGKKKYAEIEAEMHEIALRADGLRSALTAAIELDARAFDGVMAAYRMPKVTDNEKAARSEAIHHAMEKAAEVPQETAENALSVLRLACTVAEKGNLNAVTDAATAASLAVAAVTSAGANVRVNIQSLDAGNKIGKRLSEQLAAIENETRTYHTMMRDILASRADIKLL